MKPQTAQILRHLETGRPITDAQARRLYGCARLGARVWELRHKHGLAIDRELVTVPTRRGPTRRGPARIARYKLAQS